MKKLIFFKKFVFNERYLIFLLKKGSIIIKIVMMWECGAWNL